MNNTPPSSGKSKYIAVLVGIGFIFVIAYAWFRNQDAQLASEIIKFLLAAIIAYIAFDFSGSLIVTANIEVANKNQIAIQSTAAFAAFVMVVLLFNTQPANGINIKKLKPILENKESGRGIVLVEMDNVSKSLQDNKKIVSFAKHIDNPGWYFQDDSQLSQTVKLPFNLLYQEKNPCYDFRVLIVNSSTSFEKYEQGKNDKTYLDSDLSTFNTSAKKECQNYCFPQGYCLP